MLSLVNFDFSFSVGAGCLKKFSSSVLRSGLVSSGFSSGFSAGAEKKLENMSSLFVCFTSGFEDVSSPSKSAAPLEVLLVSAWFVGVFLPSLGLTDDFGLGMLGITSDF